ncbi:hypothetical protein MPDQ_002665 [Monascus purpureus]|uniref:Uncharacterized protein n=1 Tax=Monascus purpureus TaxID=5098 RepID=A0A507QM19_MONPU|nr:hypothetical protein MPDQ_002665 [Monascus purpureus]BDD60502.1 hypothetical protein MAP00_005624 [Monascus purpureus]
MSPAAVIQKSQDQHLQSLARAFAALLITTQRLSCKEKELQQQVKYAHEEYLKLAGRLPGGPDDNVNTVSRNILGHEKLGSMPEQQPNPKDVVKSLKQSGYVGGHILNSITEGLESFQSVAPLDNNTLQLLSNPCSVAANAGVLEHDFTTNGTQGGLRCPFAKPNNMPPNDETSTGAQEPSRLQNGGICGHEILDPIKAELSDRRSSQAASATSSCPIPRCPIRYMKQHTPEEIAEYVEKHKNELPRSHTICVRRYQRDSQSMRKLDAKYGNLANMIRGLGEKHQAFLPGHAESDHQAPRASSTERVEKWAEDVSSTQQATPIAENDDTNDRKGHFDRPLREIRVGESPSRPWGIHVPLDYQPAPSAPHSPTAPSRIDQPSNKLSEQIPAGASTMRPPGTAPTGRCPFGQGAAQRKTNLPGTEKIRGHGDTAGIADWNISGRVAPEDKAIDTNPASPADIVFNGPVFFGYSAEQAAAFLQELSALCNKS